MYLWNFLIKNTVNILKLQFEKSMVSCIPEKTFIQRWMFLMVPMVKKKKKLTRYFRSMQCIFPLPLVICLCTYGVSTTWLPGDADPCLPNRTLPQPPSASPACSSAPTSVSPAPHPALPAKWGGTHMGHLHQSTPGCCGLITAGYCRKMMGEAASSSNRFPAVQKSLETLQILEPKVSSRKTLTTQKPKM